jgi:hypothetical protein
VTDRSVLRRGECYPLGDRLTLAECQRYGIDTVRQDGIMARWDGSPRRPPKKGEWYFSGSTVVAYRAGGDLATPYHLAELVKIVKEVRTIYIPVTERRP